VLNFLLGGFLSNIVYHISQMKLPVIVRVQEAADSSGLRVVHQMTRFQAISIM
jgi:hypothetical protein